MRYRLRTLLILLALGPPLLAGVYRVVERPRVELLILETGSCQRGTTNDRFTRHLPGDLVCKEPPMFRLTVREVVMFFTLIAVVACWVGDRWRMAYAVEKYHSQAKYFAHLLESEVLCRKAPSDWFVIPFRPLEFRGRNGLHSLSTAPEGWGFRQSKSEGYSVEVDE